MITSWKHKGLKELFETGRTGKIQSKFHTRILERLAALDAAPTPSAMDLPGYNFHALKQFKPLRYTVYINGPWRITFEFEGADAVKVDLEQYH
jgi:proteic killer suppression protein